MNLYELTKEKIKKNRHLAVFLCNINNYKVIT